MRTGEVPFTLVYGRGTGRVVDFWEGQKSRERFENAIEIALSEELVEEGVK